MYNNKKNISSQIGFFALFALFLSILPISASQAQTFNLRIKVLDETGAPIETASPPSISLENCTTPSLSANQSLGGGIYDLLINTGVEDKNCDLRFTSPQYLYSSPIATGDLNAGLQDKTSSPITLYYRTRVVLKDSLGNSINDAIVHHAGFSPQKISGGIYYFTTNINGPLLIERAGFITESGILNTQLQSVTGGTETSATAIELSSNIPCNNGNLVPAGTNVQCAILNPTYKITVKNNVGDNLNDATVRIFTDMGRNILANNMLTAGNYDAQKSTDGLGQASFALGGGLYYVRVERIGYNDENFAFNLQNGMAAQSSIVLSLAGADIISPGHSQANADPSTVDADEVSQSIITIKLYDNNNSVLSRRDIVVKSNRTEDVITPATAQTNNSGLVTFTVTSTKPGESFFTISSGATTLSTFLKITFNVSATALASTTPSDSESKVEASVSPIASNGEATITVTVKNAAGALLQGKKVQLVSSRASEDTISPTMATTNQDGKAIFKVQSQNAGTSVITVNVDTVTQLREMAIITFSPAAQSSIQAGNLLKSSENAAVYYYGSDGKRHAFPNEKVYKSWYPDFSGVKTISASELAAISLGKNATYKPGTKMIKLQTVPKVYALSKGGVLRWVQTEELARALYGTDWNKKIDDVSDALFTDYREGSDISSASDFVPATETASVSLIDDNL